MFASDSDFEVDEEFLGAVLSCEHSSVNDAKKKHVEKSRNTRIQNSSEGNMSQTLVGNNSVKHVLSESTYNKDFNERNSTNSVVKNDQKLSVVDGGFCNTSGFSRSVERKFPGPAGLLPDKGNPLSAVVSSPKVTSPLPNDAACNRELLTYQAWQSMLESDAWKKLLMDLKNISPDVELLKNINIKYIKQRASARLLVNKKIPFLAVILQELSSSFPDPYLTLCDETGIMNGTLHRDVWKQHGEELVTGCVLLLKNVGVFSIGVKSYKNQHYLNITSNNLVSLYAPLEGIIRVTNIGQYSHEEIVTSVEEWNANATQLIASEKSSNQSPHVSSTPISDQCNAYNLSSDEESLVERSPIHHQSTALLSTSTPLSSKNIKSKETSSRTYSRSSSAYFPQSRVSNFSKFSTSREIGGVQESSEILGKNQPLLRDSSSILNLISGGDENAYCEVPLVKGVVSKQKNVLGNANNSNCTDKKRGLHFSCESSEKNNFNNYNQKNNDKNKICSNLSKFIFKCQNSGINENSDQDVNLLKNESTSIEKLHLSKDSDNISCRELRGNVESFNFKRKKPRTEAQDFFNTVEKNVDTENFDKFLDASVSNEMQLTYGHVNLDVNRFKLKKSTEETDLEKMQVDSVLEGLDVSSFIDDDF